ncbi:hypothetical protein QE152_g9796 [Popillia japonica]|uniref:Endonuclease/exonuclease/phosphatase domain-containing protein n=1 Tax=Popillia japonica TaxID=7064 RepID=A0AAW1LXQ6_POPJA
MGATGLLLLCQKSNLKTYPPTTSGSLVTPVPPIAPLPDYIRRSPHIQSLPYPTIYAGDFNSHHIMDHNGKTLIEWGQQVCCCCARNLTATPTPQLPAVPWSPQCLQSLPYPTIYASDFNSRHIMEHTGKTLIEWGQKVCCCCAKNPPHHGTYWENADRMGAKGDFDSHHIMEHNGKTLIEWGQQVCCCRARNLTSTPTPLLPAVPWSPQCLQSLPYPTIYAGDFNSHHIMDHNGKTLIEWGQQVCCCCARNLTSKPTPQLPAAPWSPQCLQSLLYPIIYAGDFNSHHIMDHNGKTLIEWGQQICCCCAKNLTSKPTPQLPAVPGHPNASNRSPARSYTQVILIATTSWTIMGKR